MYICQPFSTSQQLNNNGNSTFHITRDTAVCCFLTLRLALLSKMWYNDVNR